jgi:uncharacterized protein YqgC (DUF456 family)
MEHITLVILFSVIMSVGIVGVLFPLVPSLFYMLFIAVIYGIVDGFHFLTVTNLLVLLSLAVLSIVVDYSAGVLGAKFGGAGKRSLTYGLIGTLLGTIVAPPFGGLIGLFVGIAVGEYLRRGSGRKAVRAGAAGVLGSITGMVLNMLIAFSFLICFIVMSLS